jgi:hypothetical protein
MSKKSFFCTNQNQLFMDSSILSNLNWLHILVAAIAYFALGSIWYSGLFGQRWIGYHKIDINAADSKKGMAAIMTGSFVWMFVTTIGLAILISRLGITGGAMSGVKLGLLTGVCFSAAAISVSYLYVKKPMGLHFIDCCYHIVGQMIAGAILCAWM